MVARLAYSTVQSSSQLCRAEQLPLFHAFGKVLRTRDSSQSVNFTVKLFIHFSYNLVRDSSADLIISHLKLTSSAEVEIVVSGCCQCGQGPGGLMFDQKL